MAVKAAKGATLLFRARGPDAAAAIVALRELIARDFHGEDAIGARESDPRSEWLNFVCRAHCFGRLCGGAAGRDADADAGNAAGGEPVAEAHGAATSDCRRRCLQLSALAAHPRSDGADILAFQIAMLEDESLAESRVCDDRRGRKRGRGLAKGAGREIARL